MKEKYMVTTSCDLTISKEKVDQLFELVDKLYELDLTPRQKDILARAKDNRDVYDVFRTLDFETIEEDDCHKILFYDNHEYKNLRDLFAILAPVLNNGHITFRVTEEVNGTDEFYMYSIKNGLYKKSKGLIVWV